MSGDHKRPTRPPDFVCRRPVGEPAGCRGTANPTVVMPFGKFKGKPLDECDTEYLDWLIGQTWMHERGNARLLIAIGDHLNTRADWHRMDTEP